MSTDFHTAIATNAAGNASVINTALGQLDAAIGGVKDGKLFDTASTLTISAGVVTQTAGLHVIAAQTGTTDDLDTITPISNAQVLLITADAGDTITLKNGTGNITLDDDISIDDNDTALLYYNGAEWLLVGGSAGGASSLEANARWIYGLEVDVTATDTVRVQIGACRATNTGRRITVSGAIDIDTGTTGAAGLDTGAIASSTFYTVWVCRGTSGTTAIISTSDSSPTLPSGYDTDKRAVGMVRTTSGANLFLQKTHSSFGNTRLVLYNEDTTATPFQIFDGTQNISTSTTFDQVDCTSTIPINQTWIDIIEAVVYIWSETASGTSHLLYRLDTTSGPVRRFMLVDTGNQSGIYHMPIKSGSFYISSTTNVDEDLGLQVQGYTYTV